MPGVERGRRRVWGREERRELGQGLPAQAGPGQGATSFLSLLLDGSPIWSQQAEGATVPHRPTPPPTWTCHHSLLTDSRISWLEKPTALVAVHT